MKKINIGLLACVFLLSVSTFFFCKEKASSDLSGKFTFVKGEVFLNGKAAKLGASVNSKDSIEVKDKSGAVIQFNENALISLHSNTILDVSNLMNVKDGQPIIDLVQKSGSSFNKIVPGKAQYKLKTPTVVAGVRGTSFKVTIGEDNKVSIKLYKGKVAVNPTGKIESKSEPVILEEGNKIEASEEGMNKSEAINEVENTELKQLADDISFLDEKAMGESKSIQIKNEVESIITEAKVEEKVEVKKENVAVIQPKKVTLDDLRKQHGPLSQVITKSGQTHIGVFRQNKGKMTVITVNGTVEINAADILKVTKY